MNTIQYLTKSYARLLSLYPADFQAEFSVEMVDVFAKTLGEAARNGISALIAVCLHELADFPKNLLREYGNKLKKQLAMQIQPAAFNPKNTALLGALGFGLGFALQILLRALIDPGNHTILANFGITWLRETLLFMLIGALGGALIGVSSRSTRLIRRFTLAGTLGCGLAGSLGTLVLYLYYRFGVSSFDQAPLLNNLMVGLVSSFIGALTGAILGIVRGDRQQSVRLAWVGALGFGASFQIGNVVFGPAHIFWMQTLFSQYWVIPLALSAMVDGLIGGAILGWAMGQKENISSTPIARQGGIL